MKLFLRIWPDIFLFISAVTSITLDPILSQDDFLAYANDILRQWNTPGGMGVALVRMNNVTNPPDWIVEFASFGNATRHGEEMSPQSQISMGSESKVLTSLTIR